MTSYEKFKQKAGEEYIDHDRFLKVRSEVFSGLSARMEKNAYEDGGIGALSEKSIHAFLKRYIEPDTDYHEVALDGFFADICILLSMLWVYRPPSTSGSNVTK